MATKDKAESKIERDKKKPSRWLMYFYLLFLLLSVVIIGRIIYIQYIWKPIPEYVKHFRPSKHRDVIDPERGSILDHNGRLLAISTPLYDIYMDCYVQKEANENDKKNGEAKEAKWMNNARKLSQGLAEILKEEGKDSTYYLDKIRSGRANKRQYVNIAKGIDHGTLLKLKKLPLFNLESTKGGLIVKKEEKRLYPYGELARRVIGYVKNNDDTSAIHVGIEGKYHYLLHGKKGQAWEKRTDKSGWIPDADSLYKPAEDGFDVRTTLDINLQDIADKALRKNIGNDDKIKAGCVVILETETGAVRAMVNLQKDSTGRLYESFNMAAGEPAEPGSVFKTMTLATLLEDGKATLEQQIPTNRGIMQDMIGLVNQDQYIVNYENTYHKNTISVIHGFQISSNYVFRRLVQDAYGEHPEEFTSRLHSYNLGANFDFELTERGSGKPSIPSPDEAGWSGTSLVSAAIGYSVKVTPLQVAAFYNAIANDGKMMKPYIVERIERDGLVQQEFGPVLLNSVCSKATADTLTRALKQVTAEGTAKKRLSKARCQVAGKTGTARMHLTVAEQNGSRKPYEDNLGRKKHQGTFVGFFPADNPKYTAIVVTYTRKLDVGVNVYGGEAPAATFKDIVDEIWVYETDWSREIEADGDMPDMKAKNIFTDNSEGSPVPDVSGMGLKDAMFAIENSGYVCEYSGSGHVCSQAPEAGKAARKGQKIKIALR